MLRVRTRPRKTATGAGGPSPPPAAGARAARVRSREAGSPFQYSLPEMIEGAVSLADWKAVTDCADHVSLGASCRVGQRMAERQIGGDRGRKGAAGSVRVTRRHACRPELAETLAVEQQVDDFIARRVPALHDDRRWAHAVDPPGRLAR